MDLPADVLVKIVRDLSIRDLNRCRAVCRNWLRIINKTPNLFWGKHNKCANFDRLKQLSPKEQKRIKELFDELRFNLKIMNDSWYMGHWRLRFYGY